MTLEELIEALRRDLPESDLVVEQHLQDLPGGDEFVLMGALRDHALVLFADEDHDVLDRLLALVDDALASGDEDLADAVTADFVAASAPWEPEMASFVATWPVHLRAQAAIETARFDLL
jgi:hypothetical protein